MLPTSEEKTLAATAHLSYILGMPVIWPLLLYLWKRNDSPFVAEQAKQAVGLHVAGIILVTVGMLLSFGTLGVGLFAAIPLFIVFAISAVIFSIVAVIKIADGHSYHYPVIGEWIDRL